MQNGHFHHSGLDASLR